MDIKQPSQLIAIAESTNDAGKTLRILGTDSDNRALRSQLPDGTGVDGLLLPIHSQADFPYGTPISDDLTVKTLSASVSPINTFISTQTALVTGEPMVFSALGSGGSSTSQNSNGAFPFLVDGTTYFVGSVTTTTTGATSFQLFNSLSDANGGINPIALNSFPTGNPNGGTYTVWSPYLTVTSGQVIYWGDYIYTVVVVGGGGKFGGIPPKYSSSQQQNGAITLSAATLSGVPPKFRLSDARPVNLLTAISVNGSYNLNSKSSVSEANFSTFSQWTASISATINSYFYYGTHLYQVTVAGLFDSSTPPTFTSGSQTNGTATLTYVSGYNNSLPNPLVAGVTYFVKPLDSDVYGGSANFQIYQSLSDAQNNNNPIYLNGQIDSTGTNQYLMNFGIRNAMNPESIFTFSAPHYFSNGDAIQAVTAGTLPQPLLTNVNYFAHVISNTAISIHTNSADALTGTNPIVVTTAGTGVNSFAKFIPATAVIGSTGQIQAPGFNLAATPAAGSGAVVKAYPNGGVTAVTVNTPGGAGYGTTAPTVVFDDSGGYGYSTKPTIVITPPLGTTGIVPAVANIATLTTEPGSAIKYIRQADISIDLGTDGGSGYSINNPPTVTFQGGGGYGAVATATVSSALVLGTLALTLGGSSYPYAASPYSGVPIIDTSGQGSGALATVTVGTSGANQGKVTLVSITTGGVGYTSTSTLSLGTTGTFTGGSGATFNPSFQIRNRVSSINLQTIGSGASATTTITTNSGNTNTVTAVVIQDGGTGYIFPPRVTFVGGSPTTAATGYCTAKYSSISNYFISAAGSGYLYPPQVLFNGAGNGASAVASVNTGITSLVITYSGSGYSANITDGSITATDSTGSGFIGVFSTNGSGQVTGYTITSYGSGYTNPTIIFNGTTGNQAIATPVWGTLSSITPVTLGSGYSSPPTVTIIPTTNVFIQFSSTGTLPSPLLSGVTYRAEAPATSSSFTVKNTDFTPVNITDLGTGTFYLVINRAFGLSFLSAIATSPATITINGQNLPSSTTKWQGDFSSFYTSTQTQPTLVKFGTDYLSPAPLSTGVNYGLWPLSTTEAILFNGTFATATARISGGVVSLTIGNPGFGYSASNPPTVTITGSTPGTKASFTATVNPVDGSITGFTGSGGTGYINVNSVTIALPPTVTVTSLGTGQGYFIVNSTGGVVNYNYGIVPSTISNLQVGQNVIFTSTGVIPSWLDQTSVRTIGSISGNTIYLTANGTNNYGLPVGQMYMTVQSDITVTSSSKIIFGDALYETGTEIFVRANVNDSLPSGLSTNTAYYVRKINSTTFQVFNTFANATNTASTTGLITYTSVGNTTTSTFLVDALQNAAVVKTVQYVDKPLTDGFVSLYAFDRGRTNDMTLIGQYHPSETNPQYRRIKIGQSCSWARILYRVKAPTITSVYDYIPLEQTRAIINAIHAVDLEDKDFMEQAARYWTMAINYLKNQQNSMDGHAFNPPQINNITYGDGTDPIIDGDQFYV
jgi:hypothetical protein